MFLTALIFITILSILVLLHELGHFLMARVLGVKVEEFGLGLPPRIIGKKFLGTIYSLNYLPIGGFVKLRGEDMDEFDELKARGKMKHPKEFFWARTRLERSAILVSGVGMNFLTAVVITTFLLTQGVFEPTGRIHIEKVTLGSPAEAVGLKPNDIVESVSLRGSADQVRVTRVPSDLTNFVKKHTGEDVVLAVKRGNVAFSVTLVPRKNPPAGEGPMGVSISDLEKHVYPLSKAPVVAVRVTFERGYQMVSSIASMLYRLLTFQKVEGEVAGPIGIAQVTGQAIKFGWTAVLEFMSILSLNLAILNILPIPALDGGRLAFVVVEKVLGRRIQPKFEKSTHQIGMIILFALMLLITINDILRIARG